MPPHLSRFRYEVSPRCHSCGWFEHGLFLSSVEAGLVVLITLYVSPAMDSCPPARLHSDPFLNHSSYLGSFANYAVAMDSSNCDNFGERQIIILFVVIRRVPSFTLWTRKRPGGAAFWERLLLSGWPLRMR
jgi:hypothetical protein